MAVKAKKKGPVDDEVQWPFGTKNYIIFAVALVIIIIGYVLLGQGSMTLSPVLLVLGYCVLIPAAILWKDDDTEETSESPTKPE